MSDHAPLTLGACATLAIVWEATAPKPGNVYRGADFEDVSYADFLTSAAVIGPVVDRVDELGVGGAVGEAVAATRAAVATNTNLGTLLLVVPLAAVPRYLPLEQGIGNVLAGLSVADAEAAYDAIRLAQPGGMGQVDDADVNAAEPPRITLAEAMRLAADRDLVARQYANEFAEVFSTARRIVELHAAAERVPLSQAIVRAYLELLAAEPDSLITRKCGLEAARAVSGGAAQMLELRAKRGDKAYQDALAEFDFWLRADGHRRNPGTTADVIAAALFALLREGRLDWPVRFY